MDYEEPKTDWDTDDIVMDSDMNRIEKNIVEFPKKRYDISGTCGAQATSIIAAGFIMYQKGFFTVEDGVMIVLKNARFIFSNTNLRLRIRVDTGGGLTTVWTSTNYKDDEEPDEIIYLNTTGSPVSGFFQIEAYNSAGSSQSSQYYDSWVLSIEKEWEESS